MRKKRKLDIYTLDRGNIEEVNEFIEEHTGLVHSIAYKLMKPGLEFEDLTQEGLIGLYMSIMNFDITKGYAFSTYAYPTIYGTIQKYIRDKQGLIRLPRRIYFNYIKYLSLIEDTSSKNENVMDHFSEIEMKEIIKAHYMYKVSHLDMEIGQDQEQSTTLQDVVEGNEDVEGEVLQEEEYKSTMNLIESEFGGIEKDILKYKEKGLTQTAIADKLGLSQASVSRSLIKMKKTIQDADRYVA